MNILATESFTDQTFFADRLLTGIQLRAIMAIIHKKPMSKSSNHASNILESR